ncbi:MAG: MMPL family transporter, partial [Rhodothermales bacterium]|nr:MMPL family transporter [Rhodothermales bacterium]
QLIEVTSVTEDVRTSFGAGVTAVLLFVVLYFLYKALQVRGVSRRTVLSEAARLPVTALLLGLPLLMSLAWTFGVAQLAFDTLNLMTSTLALVLFGLGIDYGIHYYARYAEERGHDRSVAEAAETAFVSTGQAIAVSAATTAAALFCLVIADFRGFSEFGFIGGLGIVFALLAMTVVLPALIVVAERLRLLNLTALTAEPVFRVRQAPFPAARALVVGSLLVTGLALFALPGERFEYNFDKFEPGLEAYRERQAAIRPAIPSPSRRNPAYLVVDTDAEATAVTDELRRRAEGDTLILAVESLQERYASTPAEVERRLERIAAIRALTDDPFLRQDTTGQIARVRRAASTTAPIPLEAVPEDLKRRFTDKQGEVGRFVMVYPAVSLTEDVRLSMAFADRVGAVETPSGETVYAGSTSIVAADMLRLLLAESPLMVGLTLLVIVVLMGLAFRSVKWTLLALLPLLVGVVWMLGLMVVFGVKFSFYNLVVLPAVLGIGNDCGVHLVHRYREEGVGSVRRVLRSTGEHVSMGALTTMIGFSGLLLSFHPGLRSIGVLAVIGIGTTLAAALVFLPALLQWLEDRGWVAPDGLAAAPPELTPEPAEPVTAP